LTFFSPVFLFYNDLRKPGEKVAKNPLDYCPADLGKQINKCRMVSVYTTGTASMCAAG
jgi:hypothetical protein